MPNNPIRFFFPKNNLGRRTPPLWVNNCNGKGPEDEDMMI